jgi:hypothetical protein
MQPGDLFADRFEIQRLAGAGGMGTVYQALDRVTGMPVAVKVVAGAGGHERFAREAGVLSELRHPAIVRYVAHGAASHGEPFLAMQWLEGEDLARRLGRAGLTVAESLAVARRVAEGLSLAHARGVVHRDIKPSNIFLVGGDPARATLLDFGIVRRQLSVHDSSAPPMTGTGTVLGTVGYMSPEQAIRDTDLDARTDVFALGCVLLECLTGRRAFPGAHVVAVLAKVLREDAPRLRELRPELPPALDELVAAMLSKPKAGRPSDGAAVLRELEALGSIAGDVPEVTAPRSTGLSGGEQLLVSVMLAVVADDTGPLREIVLRHGGEAARLANGAFLVTMVDRDSMSEQVVGAALCALEVQRALPSVRISLAAGRAQTTDGGPPGAVIDQAAALLERSGPSDIRIDAVTAGLLGERFEVREDRGATVLVARRGDANPPRTLLGRPTPCVGRDKELGLLELTLRECIEESVARAVLVTGPSGQGKSRVRHEFVAKARERGDVAVLTARADPVGAGSSFLLVRQLVRQAVGLREGEPAGEQHARLRSHVARVCGPGEAARIADFLGVLIGAPSALPPSPQLRSARNDPRIMAVWLERSFGEWLAAECAVKPLLVVLEDLHWGDVPSVSYLGQGLRALAARPLMVLALGRPELHDAFPRLWAGLEMTQLSLGRLTPRAAERLVCAVLGRSTPAATVARIVERADGNAFYLEELIRRVAEGGGDTLPETVLALAQSRLERLEPDARRIVRAAGVFGEVFWPGGVASLLGPGAEAADVDPWLNVLCEREVLTAAAESRVPGEPQYSFRHDLLREAAYAMLTDADRVTGHGLAGEWLEAVGEREPLPLADHFEKGGQPRRAVPWLLQAAHTALSSGNVEAALALGHRGIACGAEGGERGLLRQLQGTALFMRGHMSASVEMSREAIALLKAGTTPWFVSAAEAFLAGMFLGDPGITVPVLQAIVDAPVEPEPSGPYGLAINGTCMALSATGQLDLARSLLGRAEALESATSDPDLAFVFWLRIRRGFFQTMFGELGSALATLAEGRRLAHRTEDARGRGSVGMMTVEVLAQTGHCDRADAVLQDLRAFCEPRRLGVYADWGTLHLALARVITRGAAAAMPSLSALLDRPDRFLASSARAYIAEALAKSGDLEAATREATRSLQEGAAFPVMQGHCLGVQGLVALRGGQPAEALAFAQRGLEAESRAPWPSVGSLLRLVRAEALRALGRTDDADVSIRDARDRVLRIAATLEGEPELRRSYLANIDANARTLELAREWLGSRGLPPRRDG